jgi:alpha/beta superfamily hydrolase
MAAIDAATEQWPQLPVVLAGYSFGAGIAAGVDDERVRGWYLLAPPAAMLSTATIGSDPRPKALAVPEYDHFSPPEIIADVVAGWATTTVTTVPNTDHFLGVVRPMVDAALDWIGSTLAP